MVSQVRGERFAKQRKNLRNRARSWEGKVRDHTELISQSTKKKNANKKRKAPIHKLAFSNLGGKKERSLSVCGKSEKNHSDFSRKTRKRSCNFVPGTTDGGDQRKANLFTL